MPAADNANANRSLPVVSRRTFNISIGELLLWLPQPSQRRDVAIGSMADVHADVISAKISIEKPNVGWFRRGAIFLTRKGVGEAAR
jgi:hypothetical protein